MADMTLGQLAERIGGRVDGGGDVVIHGVAPLETAGADEVAFLANDKYRRFMGRTQAAAVIVADDYDGPGETLIRCDDPYFAFREAMVVMYGFGRPAFEGVDARAAIHPEASVAANVRIGPFVTIERGAEIGEGSALYPGVYIGENAKVGRDCILHANVAVYDHSILHDRVTVHAGSSIGQDGFGYATHDGHHEKIPAAGWAELEDDVEIGACCSIDRATMGVTRIGAGTKFSNNITIGHGANLGKHCLLVAQSGIAGSTTVGDYSVFAAQSGAVGHITIGEGARVGAQSGVVSDIKPGEEVLGSPHFPLARARRIYATFSKLPEMRTAIKKLTRQVNNMLHRDRDRGDK